MRAARPRARRPDAGPRPARCCSSTPTRWPSGSRSPTASSPRLGRRRRAPAARRRAPRARSPARGAGRRVAADRGGPAARGGGRRGGRSRRSRPASTGGCTRPSSSRTPRWPRREPRRAGAPDDVAARGDARGAAARPPARRARRARARGSSPRTRGSPPRASTSSGARAWRRLRAADLAPHARPARHPRAGRGQASA